MTSDALQSLAQSYAPMLQAAGAPGLLAQWAASDAGDRHGAPPKAPPRGPVHRRDGDSLDDDAVHAGDDGCGRRQRNAGVRRRRVAADAADAEGVGRLRQPDGRWHDASVHDRAGPDVRRVERCAGSRPDAQAAGRGSADHGRRDRAERGARRVRDARAIGDGRRAAATAEASRRHGAAERTRRQRAGVDADVGGGHRGGRARERCSRSAGSRRRRP